MCNILNYITYKLSLIIENINEPFYKSNKQTMYHTLHYIILIYSVIVSLYLTFVLFYTLYSGFGFKYSKNQPIVVIFFVMLISEVFLGIRPIEQINDHMRKKYKNEKNSKLKSWIIVIFVVSLFISGFFAMFWVLDHAS